VLEDKTNYRPPWYVEPYEGESVSHYIGRYCRHESVESPSQLGKAAGIGPVLVRWEKFRFIPFPTRAELEALGKLIGLEVEQLERMLPPKDESTRLEPICLCAACYAEAPYHRMEWQYQSRLDCQRHQLRLLVKCPGCRQNFAIPSRWGEGKCKRCGMWFKSMVKRQREISGQGKVRGDSSRER
jgi:hypothetical protein